MQNMLEDKRSHVLSGGGDPTKKLYDSIPGYKKKA